MRVPTEWLLQYCDPHLEVAEIARRLTMTGTKVEAIHHHGVGEQDRFLVGRILKVRPHPAADRLQVCEVDLGAARADGPATIVCGAPNVAAGQAVAIALPGAVMPDGGTLKQAKLRGVRSEGMILSAEELNIGPNDGGILVLADQPGPGTRLSQVLPIATEVLELEVTPNRPDCLAIYGVARELHAATSAPLSRPPWQEDEGSAGELDAVAVKVACPELCPRFTARVFEEVEVGPSPLWLAARLIAAGQRPINNVVDITNYVMLLTGQPMHAFDLDEVAGSQLTVRCARDGETLVTLDGERRTLSAKMVVIDDASGPTSLAGVMGGGRSEVRGHTRRVLMEAASWDGPSIHATSSALGLRSEASARFEKGLAPEQCMHAQAVAAHLMRVVCKARLLPGTLDICEPLPPPLRLRLRGARLRSILGVDVARERQVEILRSLDFEVHACGEDLEVTVPPQRRGDVSREADLIEEVARIDGLERLPATLPARRGAYGLLSPSQRLRRRVQDALVGAGLFEVVGWTFCSRSAVEQLTLDRARTHDWSTRAVEVENPLSEEQSLLRPTLLRSLLCSAAHNAVRGMRDLRLFEVGTVFMRDGAGEQEATGVESSVVAQQTGVLERRSLGVLLHGAVRPESWRERQQEEADFYALKGVMEAIGAALHIGGDVLRCEPFTGEGQPFLHPLRAGEVICANRSIGWIGELHPRALLDGLGGCAAMELDFDALIDVALAHAAERRHLDLISFPELRRDIAVVLPAEVPAERVRSAVLSAEGPRRSLLQDVRIFDVYSGPQIGEGRRSLALSLSFRAAARTLSEQDVAPVLAKIVAQLEALGGQLRG